MSGTASNQTQALDSFHDKKVSDTPQKRAPHRVRHTSRPCTSSRVTCEGGAPPSPLHRLHLHHLHLRLLLLGLAAIFFLLWKKSQQTSSDREPTTVMKLMKHQMQTDFEICHEPDRKHAGARTHTHTHTHTHEHRTHTTAAHTHTHHTHTHTHTHRAVSPGLYL